MEEPGLKYPILNPSSTNPIYIIIYVGSHLVITMSAGAITDNGFKQSASALPIIHLDMYV